MALIVNGVTIPSSGVVTYNGVNLSSIVCNAVEVWKNGVLTLFAQVFNTSGTFTMPSNVVNNEVIVACTGGGGSGSGTSHPDYYGGGGGGSGRTVTTVNLSEGTPVQVTVGAGSTIYGGDNGGAGGTSSFGIFASCAGGKGSVMFNGGVGINGGGNGGVGGVGVTAGGASLCPSVLTLKDGAKDTTNNLFAGTSFPGGAKYDLIAGGGAGCYGAGATAPAYSTLPNSGAGSCGANFPGAASGKVIVFYYKYVQELKMNEEIIYAMIDGDGIVRNTIVVGQDWNLGGVPCGEYSVGIGDVYNFTDKKFYKTDGSLVKTFAEIEEIIAANKQV